MPSAVEAAELDETPLRHELPRALAQRLARSKAEAVATAHPHSRVLGADTVVGLGRRILPKAETETDARQCLELLSGRRHRVLTGVCLVLPGGSVRERLGDSVVAFKRLTPAEIEAYLKSGEWQGKAGGYAIQGRAAAFIRFLSGSHSNVVGLPLYETAQLLAAP